ncbi:MAG: hypothetical protein AAF927_26930, partial [Bacteroidota bacterium]
GTFNLNSDDNGDVLTMAFATTGELLVGGKFSKINGNTQVQSTALWTPGNGWQALGNGISRILDISTPPPPTPGIVREFTVDQTTGTIYAVGNFGNFYAPGSGLASLSSTSGAIWTYSTGLGNPASGGRWQTYTAHIDAQDQYLYVGGNFNADDADPFAPVPGEYVARMDLSSQQWEDLNGGITKAQPGQEVLCIQEFQDRIYIGGNFLEVSTLKCRYLASWRDPNAGFLIWDILGNGLTEACDEIYSTFDAGTWIGGQFSCLSGRETPANAWPSSGGQWFGIDRFTAANYSASVQDIYRDSLGFLIVGAYDSVNTLTGGMQLASGVVSSNFLGIKTPLATSLGGPGNFRTIYAVERWQGEVVIGGNFTSVDGTTANGLAILNANGTWSELASIGGGVVRDIFNDGDSLLYVGGTFTSVNGATMEGIAVYDGSSWSVLGQSLGFYHDVYAIAKDPISAEIAVGGGFFDVTQSNGSTLSSAGLAFWDGTQWSSRGGVQAAITFPAQYAQIVRAIDFDDNGVLYIGGEFSGVGGTAANRVARYTPGIGWEALGEGISASDCNGYPVVNTLDFHFDKLSIGGKFSRAGNTQSHGYAVYDLSVQSLSLLPDTFDVICDSTVITGNPGFTNWQWSTGHTGEQGIVTDDYFDSLANDNRRVWVYATAEKNGCVYNDSIEVAYVSSSLDPVLDYGSFEIGDSTYIYFKPAFDTAYVYYDFWLIDLNFTGDSPSDTFAIQMPCPGNYEVSIRVQSIICNYVVHQKFNYPVSYQRPVNMGLSTFPTGCLETEINVNPGYINHLWSTGDTQTWTTVDSAAMAGKDSAWFYLTADTSWIANLDTLTCTFTDSIQLLRFDNFVSPPLQAFSYIQRDNFRVDFYKQFPGKVYDVYWFPGDGTFVDISPDSDTIGSLFYFHFYPGPGTYTVKATAYNADCIYPGNIEFDVIVGATSIENDLLASTRIIPNPSRGNFSIALPQTIQGPLEIQLMDIKGRPIWEAKEAHYIGGPYPINLPELPHGIYPIQLRFAGGNWVGRVAIFD